MDYVCDHMKRIVIYDQDKISVTLTRCGECIGCYRSKAEMPVHSCTAVSTIFLDSGGGYKISTVS